MARGTNEDDELSFVSIQAATRNVTRYLHLDEKKGEPDEERSSSGDAEKRALDRLEFVKLRLRELGRFEQRAAGKRRK